MAELDPERASSERLQRDTLDSLAAIERLQRAAAGGWDDDSLLAVVTGAASSELFLPYTVPLVLRQARSRGLRVDLLIGLNNGWRCDAVLAGLAEAPDVSLLRLQTTPKTALHAPGWVVAEADPATPWRFTPHDGRHRILAVQQQCGPLSAGKDLMLLDLFAGLIEPNIEQGWRAPRTTLVFDAETVFSEHTPDAGFEPELQRARALLQAHHGNPVAAGMAMLAEAGTQATPRSTGAGADLASPGLARLIDEWRADRLDALGPLTRFCAFGARREFRGAGILLPTPGQAISALHRVYNAGCGVLEGCHCLSGAATLAKTEVLAGILGVVLRRYPDVYAEDAFFTVLAERAGLRLSLSRGVEFSNRCPQRDEQVGSPPQPAWMLQFVKWYRGFVQVQALYGAAPCAGVLGPSEPEFLAAGLTLAAGDFRASGDLGAAQALLHELARSGQAFQGIRRQAAESLAR